MAKKRLNQLRHEKNRVIKQLDYSKQGISTLAE
jgi:hypothetical protein